MAQRPPTPEERKHPLSAEEREELFRLLGELVGAIHRLSSSQARALMNVDDRIRENELSADDLGALREIEKEYKGAAQKK